MSRECVWDPSYPFEFFVEGYILGDQVTCPNCGRTFDTEFETAFGCFLDVWIVPRNIREIIEAPG